MGLLVWGEIGAAYLYSEQYADRIYREWLDVLRRDYNHPCIVVWTPLNESWGVQEIETDPRQQAHSEAMVAITKSVDTTRLSCYFRGTALRMLTASAKIRWILERDIPIMRHNFCARSIQALTLPSGTAASVATKRRICSPESSQI